MADDAAPKIGSVGWLDLTVPDAQATREFYADVVGWQVSEVPMGGYSDYCMNRPEDGETTAGICHARGGNAGLPPVWLVYFIVADLDAATRKVVARGGAILKGPVDSGGMGKFSVIRDPAGAVAALFQRAGTD